MSVQEVYTFLVHNLCEQQNNVLKLKEEFTQKWFIIYHLLTLKLFQICINFFLLLNTKEDDFEECG